MENLNYLVIGLIIGQLVIVVGVMFLTVNHLDLKEKFSVQLSLARETFYEELCKLEGTVRVISIMLHSCIDVNFVNCDYHAIWCGHRKCFSRNV